MEATNQRFVWSLILHHYQLHSLENLWGANGETGPVAGFFCFSGKEESYWAVILLDQFRFKNGEKNEKDSSFNFSGNLTGCRSCF